MEAKDRQAERNKCDLHGRAGSRAGWDGADGASPCNLVLSGSNLYGMTGGGGTSGDGTIFSINMDGTGFQTLLSFNGTNGAAPYGTMTLSGSTLYGTTTGGGSYNDGVVFSFTVPTPEPSAFALLGVGVLAMSLYNWRRI
ncbi:MAG: PEP-CTERM sorting domain-containing protein [Thermoguttaceae bacterium]